MDAKIKTILLSAYKDGNIRSNADIMRLATLYNISFSEIYRFLCKEAVRGLLCEDCIHLGTAMCVGCSKNPKKRKNHYEQDIER